MMSGYPTKPSNLAFDHMDLVGNWGSEIVLVWSFEGDGPEGPILVSCRFMLVQSLLCPFLNKDAGSLLVVVMVQ